MNKLNIEINNLGIIKNANIELNGLTVLAGLNDMGKSFINKSIYSIVNTINKAAIQWDIDKYQGVINAQNQILSLHRQYVPINAEKQQKYVLAQSRAFQSISQGTLPIGEYIFAIDELKKEVLNDLNMVNTTYANQSPPHPQQKNILVNLKNTIINVENNFKLIYNLANDKIGDADKNKNYKYLNYFDKQIISKIFQDQINTMPGGEPLIIKVNSGETPLLKIEVKNNKTTLFESLSPLLIDDVTLIDSPIIINFERYITQTRAYSGLAQTALLPDYYPDFLSKIGVISRTAKQSQFSDIYVKIRSIIGGEWVFSQDEGGLIFQKNNGIKVKPFNVATGIKSFGLIQMLLNYCDANKISLSNSIFIIDEPEVHLHPKWEIQYAELLVKLSNIGANILLSTHSPYFVEAILKYSKEYKTTNKTKFYLASDTEDNLYSSYKDVTEDVNPIFKKFADPMKILSYPKKNVRPDNTNIQN